MGELLISKLAKISYLPNHNTAIYRKQVSHVDIISIYERNALHPWFLACWTHPASVVVDMNPLLASPAVAGFPITSLERGTPLAAIWKRADFGHVLEEVVRRPAQDVYSLDPSASSD